MGLLPDRLFNFQHMLRVSARFIDKLTYRIYDVGEVFEGSEERAKNLLKKGLVVEAEKVIVNSTQPEKQNVGNQSSKKKVHR